MAEVAIKSFLGIGQEIGDMHLVLFGIEECIEIITIREVALRRTGVQLVLRFRLMTDRAGLLRSPQKFIDVAFDACLVARKFEGEFFVSISGPDDIFRDLRVGGTVMTRFALQDPSVVRLRHIDSTEM